MFLGVVGFAGVVLLVLALSARRSPVPAGADTAVVTVGDARPPRLAPSPRQATVRLLGFSLAVWSSAGLFWLAGSWPVRSGDRTAARATDLRHLHANLVLAVALLLPAYALLISTGIMDYRANRGRARARTFFGPNSVLIGAYRTVGLASMAKVFATASLYALAVLVVVNQVAS
jgi:hypothetical protein